ncbi:hypothetical protein [Carboxylicivirga sp. M1479]|uniref:hypothetical protein n=1 Tax=Carboxylicivirga sp. M1479 TaxID=2594476 RepID=UPI001178543D|nr:hypothetical protein [Carboxylicivirga sp. M1479]TRX61483.1 hypothetical protein FNN09_20360 [Carboxylicivirga sp. M1479]
MSKFIDELISKSGVAINNGKNQPALAALLLEYGYTPERMAVGESLWSTANSLNKTQQKENGEQLAATETLNKSIEAANAVYIPHLKVARIAFRDDIKYWTQLALKGKRKQSISGWLGQTNVLYTNLLNDENALGKMSEFGQTREKLEVGHQLVTKVEENLATRKKEMGEAQDATKARDKAIDDLQDWYSDYIEIARLALAGQPQYLEMMGIISPS